MVVRSLCVGPAVSRLKAGNAHVFHKQHRIYVIERIMEAQSCWDMCANAIGTDSISVMQTSPFPHYDFALKEGWI